MRIVINHAPTWTDAETWHLGSAPRLSIGQAGGEDGQQLFEVAGAFLIGARIVIANAGTHDLRFYAADGRLEARVGGEGDGPGEFRRIASFQRMGPDSLVVYDRSSRRVTVFDSEGAFSRTIRLEGAGDARAAPVGVFADGSFLVGELMISGPPDPGRLRPLRTLRMYSADGLAGDSVGFDYLGEAHVEVTRETFRPWPAPFGRAEVTTVGDHRFATGPIERYEVRVANTSGEVVLILRRSDALRAISSDEFEAEVARLIAAFPEEARGPSLNATLQAAGMPDYMPGFGPNTVSRYPPVTGMLFDSEGNLWVLEYPGPRAARSTQWSVFDKRGVWLGNVSFPEGITPLDVGHDFVLGHWRDELDVEYVGVYDLLKP